MLTELHDAAADLRARQVVAGSLAAAFADPRAASCDTQLAAPDTLLHSAWRLVAEPHGSIHRADLGFGEIPPGVVDFEPVIRWLQLDPERRERAFQHVFGLVISKTCPPCETEYLTSRDVFHRAQQLADIAGFYLAFGLEPSRLRRQRADHIALELEFVALLLEKLATSSEDGQTQLEHTRIDRDALAAFLADHLTTWAPAFGQRVVQRGIAAADGLADETERLDARLLVGVARALCGWIVTERRCFALPPLRRVVLVDPAPADETDTACHECESCPEPPAWPTA